MQKYVTITSEINYFYKERTMGEHDGHRQRIIQKLNSGMLLEHELLEVFLFNALPRVNTNDLAHRLLAEFGTIDGVFAAKMEDLEKIKGVGRSAAAYICCAGKIFSQYYDVKMADLYPQKFESKEFLPYVKKAYKNLTREVLDVYLLDEDCWIIGKRRFGSVNYFNAEMHPEELTKLFVEFEPSGIVLVHNHPYGEAEISDTDDYTTRQIQLICSTQNILLCDHIIYAKNGLYSYYLGGKLKEIAADYSLSTMLMQGKKNKKGGAL